MQEQELADIILAVREFVRKDVLPREAETDERDEVSETPRAGNLGACTVEL
jgi:hypothetical protein